MELLDGEMEHTMDPKMDDIFYDLFCVGVPMVTTMEYEKQ